MFVVTHKKTGQKTNWETRYDAEFYIRVCVVFNNRQKVNSDRKTNYIIEEKEDLSCITTV